MSICSKYLTVIPSLNAVTARLLFLHTSSRPILATLFARFESISFAAAAFCVFSSDRDHSSTRTAESHEVEDNEEEEDEVGDTNRRRERKEPRFATSRLFVALSRLFPNLWLAKIAAEIQMYL